MKISGIIEKFKNLIGKKESAEIYSSIALILIVGILEWGIKVNWETLFFVTGAVIGVFFVDIAEEFFSLTPSPFKSIIFAAGFTIVSFFIVTSGGSAVATGLVLTIYLSLIWEQYRDLKKSGNLDNWYQMVSVKVPLKNQKLILWIFTALFIIESVMFIR